MFDSPPATAAADASATPGVDCSTSAQSARRERLWSAIRERARSLFDNEARFIGPLGGRTSQDPRIPLQLAGPMLLGDETQRAFANEVLRNNPVKIGQCSFSTDYTLATWHNASHRLDADVRAMLLEKFAAGVGHYAKLDLQHHGVNDNHVTLATSSLVLAGELVGDREAVEQGRCNLLNLRDTLLRCGVIHEANDCYFWHTMYSTAAVARWAKDEAIRDLATKAEARLWAEHAAFRHPNLGRKIGPSARDYTKHRLHPRHANTALWYVFGDAVTVPAMPLMYVSDTDANDHAFDWSHASSAEQAWTLGFLARVSAQSYVVPNAAAAIMADRAYPHTVSVLNETGHFPEGYTVDHDGAEGCEQAFHHLNAVQFPGREHTLYAHMERDWGMGTGDGRMIGGCPNNTWQLSYRKARPLEKTWQQGHWWCSYTINDKTAVEDHTFHLAPPSETGNGQTTEYWFRSASQPRRTVQFNDMGRYAGMQHERTSVMLYRPRPIEAYAVTSLALTLCYPTVWRNDCDELWFGDQRIDNWAGESAEAEDIFIKDGPIYAAFKPLLCRPLDAPARLRAERRNDDWSLIHLISYEGEAVDLSEEARLSQIGSGFICEVATEDDFDSLDAFKRWFRTGRVLDETHFWTRQVRWARPGLTLGMRYDVWNDHIMYRMVNGRRMRQPEFECTGIDNTQLPWLTEDVSDWDHIDWAIEQARRPLSAGCREPDRFER